jgi:uncharacterized membrane protein YozB (DUF420 family)
MNNERPTGQLHADHLGVIASALCLVHCILTPVALSLSAVWVHYLPSEERLHRVLAALVAAIGCIAIVRGYRKHRRQRVFFLMAGGLGLIFAGAYFGDRLPSHVAEITVTMAGSSLMIAAHFLNHTFCKNCDRCDRP